MTGVAARAFYWAYTGHTFEDALITDTHARNAVEGIGLTPNYAVGHVQGFTSALSVLIPLLGELLHAGSGLDAMRAASIVAFVASAAFAYLLARRLGAGAWPTGFLLAYLSLDYTNIMFGMAGMETQLAVTAVLAVAYFVAVQRFLEAGTAIGLSVLARPDFLMLAVPALVALCLLDYKRGCKALGLAGLVVAPWLVFTTLYYGSPVPQTILAKAQEYNSQHAPIGHTPGSVWHFITSQLSAHEGLWRYLAPFGDFFEVAKTPLPDSVLFEVAVLVALMAVVGAYATRHVPGLWCIPTYVVLFAVYKVFLLPPTYDEWYNPPFLALVMLMASLGLTRTAGPLFGLSRERSGWPAARSQVVASLSIVLSLLFAWQVPLMFPLDRQVQQVEDHVRMQVGLYLKQVVKPGQPVATESAGYIGYYSSAELYDYPGLTSPVVYHTLRHLPPAKNTLEYMVAALAPPWAVLRPAELALFKQVAPRVAREYRLVKTFEWGSPVFSFGGLTYVDIDTKFYVLRRQ